MQGLLDLSLFLPLFIVSYRLSFRLWLFTHNPNNLDADIVCSRAKNHYDPNGDVDFDDSETQQESAKALDSLDAFKRGFKPLHKAQATLMYFSVCDFTLKLRSVLDQASTPTVIWLSLAPTFSCILYRSLFGSLYVPTSPFSIISPWICFTYYTCHLCIYAFIFLISDIVLYSQRYASACFSRSYVCWCPHERATREVLLSIQNYAYMRTPKLTTRPLWLSTFGPRQIQRQVFFTRLVLVTAGLTYKRVH